MNIDMRKHPAYVTFLIMAIGILVGGNFTLMKVAVSNGIPHLAALFWQLAGASLILLLVQIIRGQVRQATASRYLRYYLVGGLLGISMPQYLSFRMLEKVPATYFTLVVTLAPLFTCIVLAVLERAMPRHKAAGVLIGLAGVSLVSVEKIELGSLNLMLACLPCIVPLMLAFSNIYRNRAYPTGAQPLALATGTLLSQAILVGFVYWLDGASYIPIPLRAEADYAVLAIAAISGFSYLLTFELQRFTDGLGSSQTGYVVTLTGVVLGAFVFNEPIGPYIVLAVILLFMGVAVGNGHVDPTRWINTLQNPIRLKRRTK